MQGFTDACNFGSGTFSELCSNIIKIVSLQPCYALQSYKLVFMYTIEAGIHLFIQQGKKSFTLMKKLF